MNRLPPLRLLTVLDATVRCGGTKRAAIELNVSQPAVSQSIKQLEDHVGVSLLDRRTRPPKLTQAGQILAQAAHVGISALETAMGDIAAIQSEENGSVTISCNLGYVTYWLMPRLHGFYARYPDRNVNIQSVYHGQPGLRAGADMAIRFGDGNWKDGSSHLLFQERITPVCTSSYRQKHGRLKAPEDLLTADLIHVDPVETYWYDWPAFLKRQNVTPPATLSGRRYNNYVQAVQATLAGDGIMLGWRGITDQIAAESGLVPAMKCSVVPESAVYVCVAFGEETKQSVLDCVEWLREQAM